MGCKLNATIGHFTLAFHGMKYTPRPKIWTFWPFVSNSTISGDTGAYLGPALKQPLLALYDFYILICMIGREEASYLSSSLVPSVILVVSPRRTFNKMKLAGQHGWVAPSAIEKIDEKA